MSRSSGCLAGDPEVSDNDFLPGVLKKNRRNVMVLKPNYLDKAANSRQVFKKSESNRVIIRVDQMPMSSIWRLKSSIVKDFPVVV